MSSLSVSVVIPTYNRARFLPAAIASIRAQTSPCAEVVVVDDGSTDDTKDVLTTVGNGIVYLRQANAGPAAARNLGIRAASGDLVAFLDTDDRWQPDKIASQIAVFRRHPSVALVSTDMAIEDEHGALLVASNFAKRGLAGFFKSLDGAPIPDAPRRLLQLNFINTSTVVVRREVLLALNGFDTRLRYGEDLELWMRIAARHDIACLPNVAEVRVEHSSNVTKSIEPMLRGYVDMARIIREWAQGVMPNWGVNPNRYVADALTDLGYWYFREGRRADAARALDASLREHATRRAWLYKWINRAPAAVVRQARRLKSLGAR